jgi:hypothetical protein
MSDRSPLFVSALELIAHATELYAQKRPRNYKFAILHLANAIELILKDRLIDGGISIYKPKTSYTLDIWTVFEELDKIGIKIAKRPTIELLVDDRNTIQHRYGFPNAESVYYHLEEVVDFFKIFLDEQYGVDLAEALKPHLSKEHLALLGLLEDELAYLDKLMKLSPEAAIVQAFGDIERAANELIDTSALANYGVRSVVTARLAIQQLEGAGFLPNGSATLFDALRMMSNTVAHSGVSDSSDRNWVKVLQIAKDLYTGIRKAREAGYSNSSQSSNSSE